MWFEGEAPHLSFDLYCAVLSSGWYLNNAFDTYDSGGMVQMFYLGSAGASLHVSEGHFCAGDKSHCGFSGTSMGQGSFGGRTGDIDQGGPNSWVFWADASSGMAYEVLGAGMSLADFKSILTAMHKVPKS